MDIMPRETIDHSTIRKKLLDSTSNVLINRCKVELPSITLPELSTIEVIVPPIRQLDVGDVVLAFEYVRRDFATVQAREVGAALESDDEAVVDLIAYSDGKIVPFSLRSKLTVVVGEDPLWPELGQALVGRKVGSSEIFPLVLPVDPAWGRQIDHEAQVACTIRAGQSVKMPEPNDPDFLAATGLGNSLDELMGALARECMEQRIQEQQDYLRELVVLAALEKSDFEVPGPLVDAEIRDWFRHHEGDVMVSWGLSADEQAEALRHWLEDPLTVLEAQRRVAGAMLLGTVARTHELEVTNAEITEYMNGIAEEMQRTEGVSVDVEDLTKHLSGKNAEALKNHLLSTLAMEFLLNSVQILEA